MRTDHTPSVLELSRAASRLGSVHTQALTDILTELENTDIIRVKFEETLRANEYHYKCKNAEVGDWVAVYSPILKKVVILRVIGRGISPHFYIGTRQMKEATLVQKGGTWREA